MATVHKYAPKLVVSDAAAAIEFYVQAMGAKELARYGDSGRIVHAELALGEYLVMVKDEDSTDPGPTTLGGSPVLMSLSVDNVIELARRMTDAGATVLIPIKDHGTGRYDGRLRDPFGHLWIIGQPV